MSILQFKCSVPSSTPSINTIKEYSHSTTIELNDYSIFCWNINYALPKLN